MSQNWPLRPSRNSEAGGSRRKYPRCAEWLMVLTLPRDLLPVVLTKYDGRLLSDIERGVRGAHFTDGLLQMFIRFIRRWGTSPVDGLCLLLCVKDPSPLPSVVVSHFLRTV